MPTTTPGSAGSTSAERFLGELQEYYEAALRERTDRRREHGVLNNRLSRLEHELRAEEQIGHDLVRRIETLEAALVRERQHQEGGATEAMARCKSGAVPLTELGLVGPSCSSLLAAYLERLPKVREQGCGEHLRARLRECGIHRTRTAPEPALAPNAEQSAHTWMAPRTWSGGRAFIQEAASSIGTIVEGDKDEDFAPTLTWAQRWTLRSHLDGVRCVVGDAAGLLLLSCGEDALIKGWDLRPLWRGVESADDMEPYATLRGHTAPVLAMAYREQDGILFSAGMDESIRAWRLPNSLTHNTYGTNLTSQDRAMRAGMLLGHTDSVWALKHHPHLPFLASAGGDGIVALWDTKAALDPGRPQGQSASMEATFAMASEGSSADAGVEASLELPACIDWVPSKVSHLLVGYASSKVAVFDVKRGKEEMCSADAARVTSACCHQVQNIAVLGHTDYCARLLDLSSMQFVSTFADHADAVTSVCIDPTQGNTVVTGCHDGCVRTFDIRMGRCRQRLWLHRAKYDEAVHCVHHGPRILATGGADGCMSVLLPSE